MVDAWIPGAERLRAAQDGGALRGGAPRVVWMTTETDPVTISAWSSAQRLAHTGRPCHLVWNPLNAEIVQLIPVTRAACGLEVGTAGRVCVQIRVAGMAHRPFTHGPMHGLDAILRWLDTWGVARRWPGGPPPAPATRGPRYSRRTWSGGGHFSAAQLPGSTEPGPGAIDPATLLGRQAGVPLQRGSAAPAAPGPAAGSADAPIPSELLSGRTNGAQPISVPS